MLEKSEREQIIALIHQEVVPAIGCTEPIAVALFVAKATAILKNTIFYRTAIIHKKRGGWKSAPFRILKGYYFLKPNFSISARYLSMSVFFR